MSREFPPGTNGFEEESLTAMLYSHRFSFVRFCE